MNNKERLTRRIEGGIDKFGMPLVKSYEIIDRTPGLANAKVRCQLGRYEDTELTPEEVAVLKAENKLLLGQTMYRPIVLREADFKVDKRLAKRYVYEGEIIAAVFFMMSGEYTYAVEFLGKQVVKEDCNTKEDCIHMINESIAQIWLALTEVYRFSITDKDN